MEVSRSTARVPQKMRIDSGRSGEKANVVAVIPAYNEERFIASVVIKTRGYASHVIVVDDGSTDRTAELAEVSGARVVRLEKNQGKAAALNAGFKAALQLKPDAVVCLDGDAQHEPAEIPELVRPILAQEADVVVGSRFLEKRSPIPGWRQLGQHTLTAVTNLTSGVKISDSQSGYRAFSPKAVRTLRFRSSGLSVESEMQFLFSQAGLKVKEVPISVSYADGSKRNPVVQGLQILDAILSLVARRRPLLFFSLPGLFLGVIGVLLGIRVALHMQATGELLMGTAILTTLALTGGLLLGVAGVMLHSIQHMIRRIQEEIRDAMALRREDTP
ncbi:glycosyl transferase family 2 [Marinithermus hydrothermalis DSM 14884]|uniref:Glycosyl transferase family 2 n=2 Tax=Marinithermus TaxID=186191 RepID=F2NL79_MARHT|nr:glycosyl transferase family 2 [Marinithermus hydrothermalis DSM 14884]